MKYRLLIAVEVLDFTAVLPRREQEVVWKRFREIREYPHQYSDYREPDSEGRMLEVHVHSDFPIHFWEDGASCHINILQICLAGR